MAIQADKAFNVNNKNPLHMAALRNPVKFHLTVDYKAKSIVNNFKL